MGYGSGGRGTNNKTFDEEFTSMNNNSSQFAVTDTKSKQNDFFDMSSKNVETPSRRTKGSQDFAEGVVTGYEIETDDSGFLKAWFRSLAHGVPFVTKSQEHIFQLVSDEFDASTSCTEVHLFGCISSGKLNNGEKVRVYGSRDSSGAFIAKKILKLNNNMRVTLKQFIPAFCVRAITVLLLSVIALAIISLLGEDSGQGTSSLVSGLASAAFWKKILAGVIVLLTVLFSGKIRRFTRIPLRILWIVTGVLVLILIPETMSILVWVIILLAAFRLLKEIVKVR